MAADELLAMQRRIVDALHEPIFGPSRDRSDLPPRRGGVSENFRRTAEAFISPSDHLSAVDRLELYHRQVWYRLLDSIAEDFPVLRAHLGEASFWGLIEAHIEGPRPQSYTMQRLGLGLPELLATQRPRDGAAVELARIELAACTNLEAARGEPVPAAELAQAPLAIAPHVQLMTVAHNVDTLWRRHRRDLPVGPLRELRKARRIATWRGAGPQVEALPEPAYHLLQAIAECGALEPAMDQLLAAGQLGPKELPRIGNWFTTWTERRWLVRPLSRP